MPIRHPIADKEEWISKSGKDTKRYNIYRFQRREAAGKV